MPIAIYIPYKLCRGGGTCLYNVRAIPLEILRADSYGKCQRLPIFFLTSPHIFLFLQTRTSIFVWGDPLSDTFFFGGASSQCVLFIWALPSPILFGASLLNVLFCCGLHLFIFLDYILPPQDL